METVWILYITSLPKSLKTLRIKDQSVSALRRNNCYLSLESYETLRICKQNAQSLIINVDAICGKKWCLCISNWPHSVPWLWQRQLNFTRFFGHSRARKIILTIKTTSARNTYENVKWLKHEGKNFNKQFIFHYRTSIRRPLIIVSNTEKNNSVV
jgi:hypothetical protein